MSKRGSGGPGRRRWWALGALSLVQLVLNLDTTVVNVALPPIERDLGMGPAGLAWVVNGYALAFGGLLLLGGRLADLFGRRRVFLLGLSIFALASATAGLSAGPAMLVAGRFLQGGGAALVTPAALALVTLLFAEEKERARALSVWGGLAVVGSTAGVLLGGLLSDLASWRWIFLLNLPVAALALALVPLLVGESRSPEAGRGGLDLPGAVLVTAGLSLSVFALLDKGAQPWAAPAVLVPLAAGVSLLCAFVVVEARTSGPLVPLDFFRSRTRSTANLIVVLVSAALATTYFSLSLYMQQVLGYSPLSAGLAYLPLCAAIVLSVGAAPVLVPRFGARPVASCALVAAAAGLILLSGISAEGTYPRDVLPGMLLMASGVGAAFVAVTIAAMQDASGENAGLAGGVLNASQQVGGAVGLAALVSLAASRTADLLAAGADRDAATTGGFALAFGAAASLTFLCAVVAHVGFGKATRR